MQGLRYLRLGMLGLIICILAGWIIQGYIKNSSFIYKQEKAGVGNPLIGGDFELIDQYGQKRSNKEFLGKYLLIYFGYSFCPDICPLGLHNISESLKLLGRDRQELVPLFITIDPDRDTPSHLKDYAANFHPSFIMLSGESSSIKQVLKDFRVYAVKAPNDASSDDYLMDHSTMIYLMGREGTLLQHFPHSTLPETLAHSVRAHLINEAKHSS